jgi:hypothetical protein
LPWLATARSEYARHSFVPRFPWISDRLGRAASESDCRTLTEIHHLRSRATGGTVRSRRGHISKLMSGHERRRGRDLFASTPGLKTSHTRCLVDGSCGSFVKEKCIYISILAGPCMIHLPAHVHMEFMAAEMPETSRTWAKSNERALGREASSWAERMDSTASE